MGRPRYPRARSLLITADAGGSNGSRLRLWKWELQQLADRTGLTITVCHFPPGTSKWNKIEHRLFSYITRNWRGQPLVSLAVIVNLIGATRRRPACACGARSIGARISKAAPSPTSNSPRSDLRPIGFTPDWNYTIHPVRRR